MIQFLFRGILRDRSRSMLPVIIISIGVFLTVVLSTFMKGVMGDMIDMNANFTTGHVKVMTRAYAENIGQIPNDLAILEVGSLVDELKTQSPDMHWVERIHFGGLMDLPDANGETRAQGPASGLAISLLNPNSGEVDRLNIRKSIISGSLPTAPGEALISHDFAEKIKLRLGEEITFFGSTMNSSMTFQNFKVTGTVRFGAGALDRGSVIVDLTDAQAMLDMQDAAGEVLGYLPGGAYNDKKAEHVATAFNKKYADDPDEFAPQMLRLKEQNQLASMVDYVDMVSGLFVFIFVFAMSIVLWNTGLLGGLRRYNEFGIRLALGEPKNHIFKTLLYEGLMIGAIGSISGTVLGLSVSFYLQEYGLDFSQFMQNASMMMPSVYRAYITPEAFYIGFIPGLFSMVLGNALAGIGIYQRNTAQLFKELEV